MTLAACAPSSAPASGAQAVGAAGEGAGRGAGEGPCRSDAAQAALGQAGTPQLAEWARQQAGALKVRVIGHDDMVTKEYDTTRLNLQLDEGGKVVRVYCG